MFATASAMQPGSRQLSEGVATSGSGKKTTPSKAYFQEAPIRQQATTIAIGAIGGLALWWAGVPAGAMSGAMALIAFVGAFPKYGAPLIGQLGSPMRYTAMLVSGVSIGASVTLDTLRNILAYPASVIGMMVCVVAMTATSAAISVRFSKWDRETALLAAVPGAMAYILSIVLTSGANAPRVVATQMFRVFFLVALVPMLVAETGMALGTITARPADTLSVFVVECIGGGLVGYLFTRLKVAGGMMLGAMFVSGALHASGFATGRAPTFFLIAGQVLIGCWTGSRFVGFDWSRLLREGPSMFAAIGASVAVSAIFSGSVSGLLGLPFGATFLAYSPGGFEAMTVLAMALGFDPFYVAAHHLARFFMLNIGLPLTLSGWLRRLKK
jgi:membrane AbrB-like protein